jgi:hypothetical protein
MFRIPELPGLLGFVGFTKKRSFVGNCEVHGYRQEQTIRHNQANAETAAHKNNETGR